MLGQGSIDLARDLTSTQILAPVTLSATTTTSAVDVTNAHGKNILIEIDIGVVSAADATNLMTFKITQSSDASTYTDLPTAQYDVMASWDKIINATTEGSTKYRFNIQLSTGYYSIKLVGTETGTFSGHASASVIFVEAKAA